MKQPPHFLADTSLTAIWAAIAAAVASIVTGTLAWLKNRNTGNVTVRRARITANAQMIGQLISRVTSLETICSNQQVEIGTLQSKLIDLARENERLMQENKHLRGAEEMVEKVRQEKHEIANLANRHAIAVVALKHEINTLDVELNREPRFKKPADPTMEDQGIAP